MKRVLNMAVALGLVLVLSLSSPAQVTAVKAPITVEVTNPIAYELSDYIVTFQNVGLLVGATDYIDVMFPAGTDVTTVTAVTVSKGPTSTGPFAGVATTHNTVGAQTVRIRLDAAEFIEHSDWVLIVLDDVTNPAPGSYSLCVGTSNASVVCSGPGDSNVVATYMLTMSVDPADGGAATDLTDEAPYAADTVVSIKAEAAVGYQFVEWTAVPDVTFGDPNAAETTLIMPDEAVTVTANFELIPALTFSLTMMAEPALGGTATDEAGASPYEEGAIVAIKAVAASGYRFVNWTALPEDVLDNAGAAETTLTMPGEAVTVTANFLAVYDLSVSSTTGGAVTAPGEGTFAYDTGTVVDLVAEPEDGYQFVGWSGDLAAIADPDAAATTIIVDGDYSVTAGFEEVEPLVSGGCFIATAAYGTPMAREIQILRDFRDECLLTNPLGAALVDFYYRVSPPIAEFITRHPALKPVVRAGLAPAVAMSGVVVNTAPAEKAALTLFLLLVSAAVALWATKRRRGQPGYASG